MHGWDYVDVDAVRYRRYRNRGDKVDVVGTFAHTDGVHGLAFAHDLKRSFASNGRANSVTVFDLDTLQPRQEARVAAVTRMPSCTVHRPASCPGSTGCRPM